MTCDSYCVECNQTGGKYIITGFSPPQSVNAGAYVTLNLTVSINCTLCTNNAFLVCLHDDNGCVDSTGGLWFPSGSNSLSIQLHYTQPSSNFHGKLSLIGKELLGDTCYDSKTFTVTTIAQPGQGYSCNSSTKTCYQDNNSTITYSQCQVNCSGSGGSGLFGACSPKCTSSDMCVLGVCLPKPFVGLAIVGFLFMMMKK